MPTVRGLIVAALPLCALSGQVLWERPLDATSLTGRTGAAMAHDAMRSQTVLFGGLSGAGPGDETWAWSGAGWRLLEPAVRPPARSQHAMAYDAARSRIVLFGGVVTRPLATSYLGDHWEWDGTSWSERSQALRPSARAGAAMCFDATRGRIVLFGGGQGSFAPPAADAHWEWDGASWLALPGGPPPRSLASLSHDAARGECVLFGGAGQCFAFSCPTLADTWTFDGTNWTQRAVAGPAARHSAAMAYDAQRARVVLLGGQGGCAPACSTNFSDCHEWDGAQWVPGAAPAPRLHGAAMAYDPPGARCLIFGGATSIPQWPGWLSAETFSYDGTAFVAAQASTMPPARNADVLCYDEARRQTLWFGTTVATNPGVAGTFVWDGAAWTARNSAHLPPPRTNHAMAYDRARQRVVLFGGTASNGTFLRDTWEWDGTDWATANVGAGPPAQYGHALAFDSQRNVTVLYPGAFGQNLVHEYDGLSWIAKPTSTMPPYRLYASLCFDERRGRTILFGGLGTTALAETWEWDGAAWLQVQPPIAPPGRAYARMAYDSLRGRCILVGGQGPGSAALADCWEYDGLTWTERTGDGPSPRMNHALAYDRARHKTVLFGGYGGPTSFGYLHDTWELAVLCDRAGPGDGGGGGGLALSCSGLPRLGSSFCLSFANQSPQAAGLDFLLLTPAACSQQPTPLPAPPGCVPSLLYGNPSHVLVAMGGNPSFCFSVPVDPALQGVPLCCQGSSFETPGCFRPTDGVHLVIR